MKTKTPNTLQETPDRRTNWMFTVNGAFVRWCGTLVQFTADCENYVAGSAEGHWEKLGGRCDRFHCPIVGTTTFRAEKQEGGAA